MSAARRRDPSSRGRLVAARDWWRRALRQFLAFPVVVVAGFLVLAVAVFVVDQAVFGAFEEQHGGSLLSRLFGDREADSSLLSTVAQSIISVTAITFSLLLVAVQQGAASLTNQVFDQFLHRRSNQFFFGYFVGLSIFALFNLATVSSLHQPVLGTLLSLVLTAVALCMVVVLIYTTIDQMQAPVVVREICRQLLMAREGQHALLGLTRRTERPGLGHAVAVAGWTTGYVDRVEVAPLEAACARVPGVELRVAVSIGQMMGWGETLAELRSAAPLPDAVAAALSDAVRAAVVVDDERALSRDPGFGVMQLATIAWTSASSASSNPASAVAAVQGLRDVLLRWAGEAVPEAPGSAVVYPDNLVRQALDGVESVVVAASESLQHQTLAEAYALLASVVGRLPAAARGQVEAIALASLTTLGEHVPARPLLAAADALAVALGEAGCAAGAEAVARDAAAMRGVRGRLGSRGDRAAMANGG